MTILPNQLKPLFFLKLIKNTKRPLTSGWQSNPLGYDEIIEYRKKCLNYGVLCGYRNLVVIDFDNEDFFDDYWQKIPKTFVVRTPKKGYHFYYYVEDVAVFNCINNKKGVISLDYDNQHYGEIRFGKVFVLGPGSIHPDTLTAYEVEAEEPISTIKANDILTPFKGLYKENKPVHEDYSKENIIPIRKLVEDIPLIRVGDQLIGPHPCHDSTTGTNFCINESKNSWYCFRHETGGGPLSLFAMREGIIKCEDAKKGAIRGKVFKKVRELLYKKHGIKLKINQAQNGKDREDKTLDALLAHFNDDKILSGLFQFNEFTSQIEYTRPPLWPASGHSSINDTDIKNCRMYLSVEHDYNVSQQLLSDFIDVNSFHYRYHPVRDWIKNLVWDGKSRIDRWLIDYCGVIDNEYTRQVARKVLCGAVNRVFNPGCKFDYMMILEGKQGIGKTQLVKALAGSWYADIALAERDKDTIDAMRGAWIIEVSEMVGFKKQEIEQLKAFITRDCDRVRLAYERLTRDFPRQSIFIGSMNPEGDNSYLKDSTGNRRFWPVDLKFVRLNDIKDVRSQLFAEAYIKYKEGEKLYLSNDAESIAQQMQADRQEYDIWTPIISDFVRIRDIVSADEIATQALNMDKGRIGRFDQIRIGKVMKSLGWKKTRRRDEDGRGYIYVKMFENSDLGSCPY